MPETVFQQSQPSNDEISLKELILKIADLFDLKTKWRIVFFIAIIGCGIGFLYAYLQKPTYTATLTFALEDDKGSGGGGFGNALGLASSLGIDLGAGAGGAFSGSNLIELMKSRKLVELTLLNPITINGEQISLAELYIRMNNWKKKWGENSKINLKQLQFIPGIDRSKFTLQQDSILEILYDEIIKKNLSVEQKDKKVSIITIEVKTEDELFSKYFTEILAKEVSNFYIDTKSKKAKINVEILEKQVDSIRAELNGAITGVAIANDNTYNLNPALNVKRTSSSKRQVDVQANTAILTELVRNLELAKVTLRKETPLIQIIDSPILPLKKEKYSKIKSLLLSGLLAGLLSVLFFIFQRWWKSIWVN